MEKSLLRELDIGGRILPGNLALAPMAGTSDLTFRSICHEMGASFVCTELVSARGIRYSGGILRSYRYLEIDPAAEGPVAIQLFGHDPEDFRQAIPMILEHPVLKNLFCIDINMGCPVTKVVKTGAGSALMKDPALASSILMTSVRAAEPYGVPVTVKFRKGWNGNDVNAVAFARMCRDSGAKAMTLHARTRDQMYSGAADWTSIRDVADALRGSGIPLFGNGDIKDGAGAVRMLSETGCDGVMIGRSAQGNPWIFTEIKAALLGKEKPVPPTPEERADMIRKHLCGCAGKLGETLAVREMRAQLAMYLKGQQNATTFKVRAMSAETIDEVEELLAEWVGAQTIH